MAHKFRLDFDGQSVVQTDYNGLASEASTSEDHVYAELFRLLPDSGSVARGIIPYGTDGIIAPNGASGSVLINPFRALIGSRTLVAAGGAANYQDVRSSLSITDAATALTTSVSLTANVSGNSRFDAIYAAVTVDSVSTPTTRKVKNPGTGVVTDESVSVYSHTAVAVSVVAGTPAATPAFPTIPADAGDVYYILLGYVRVPTGFGAGSTVLSKNINDSSITLGVDTSMGTSRLRPANQSYVDGGTGISRAGTSPATSSSVTANKWTGTSSSRPVAFMPSAWQGQESRIIVVDLLDASSANWSHASGDILDSSVDWSQRIFKWIASIGGVDSHGAMPWNYTAGSPNTSHLMSGNPIAPGYSPDTAHPALVVGVGTSFNTSGGASIVNLASSGGAGTATPATGFNVPTNAMITGTAVKITQSSGNLILTVTGVPLCSVIIWLDATSKFPNA